MTILYENFLYFYTKSIPEQFAAFKVQAQDNYAPLTEYRSHELIQSDVLIVTVLSTAEQR